MDYQGACGGIGPKYHCGSPDGWKDRRAARKSAILNANIAMSQQSSGCETRDFRYGFQQAFLDIANGGSGALPAIPPSRYWAAPYRTGWGHDKARSWFEGYEAGAAAAKCGSLCSTGSVPTSAQRGPDNQVHIGLAGGICQTSHLAPSNTVLHAAPFGGYGPYSPTRYPAMMNSASPVSGPMMPAPQGTTEVPGSDWSTTPRLELPAPPNDSIPPAAPITPPSNLDGHSIAPQVPMTQIPTTQWTAPETGPVSQISGYGPRGFRSEGAMR